MTNQTKNVAENNAALPTPPIIGISMTEPATDRRLNWTDDLSILLEDVRTCYSDTESVIGEAGYLFREVYDLRTEEGEELAQLQSEWRERTPIHALKLTMFRNDIKSAFVARREVVPVNADILVDLAVQLNSLCVVVTEEKLEQFWTSLFALDREIATLAQTVSLRKRSGEMQWSLPRTPKVWEESHLAESGQWDLKQQVECSKAFIDLSRNVDGDASGVAKQDPVRMAAAHSESYRCVNWFRTKYEFTPGQAGAVKVLWEAWERGVPSVSSVVITDAAGGDSTRVRDVFKRRGREMHPAWGTMICKHGRDLYFLQPPNNYENPT